VNPTVVHHTIYHEVTTGVFGFGTSSVTLPGEQSDGVVAAVSEVEKLDSQTQCIGIFGGEP
jgi:hypothetical protein